MQAQSLGWISKLQLVFLDLLKKVKETKSLKGLTMSKAQN